MYYYRPIERMGSSQQNASPQTFSLTRRANPLSVTSVMSLTHRDETPALVVPAADRSIDHELIVGLLLLVVLLIGRAGTGAL